MGKKGKHKVQHAWMEETPETPARALVNELYRAHHKLISGTLDTQTLAILLKQVILHLEVPETVVIQPEPKPGPEPALKWYEAQPADPMYTVTPCNPTTSETTITHTGTWPDQGQPEHHGNWKET